MTFLAPFRDLPDRSLPSLIERLGRMMGARPGRSRRRAGTPSGRGCRREAGHPFRRRAAEPAGRLSEFDYNYYVALERGASPAGRPGAGRGA